MLQRRGLSAPVAANGGADGIVAVGGEYSAQVVNPASTAVGRVPLPGRIAERRGETASGPRDCLRERLVGQVSGALRARDPVELDAWLGLTDPGEALNRWFGAQAVAEQGWLLLALERDIADIDALLSAQVNAILHAPLFQRLEARWRGLELLVDVAELSPLAKPRVLLIFLGGIAQGMEAAR